MNGPYIVRQIVNPIGIKTHTWIVVDKRAAVSVGEYASRRLARIAANKFNAALVQEKQKQLLLQHIA